MASIRLKINTKELGDKLKARLSTLSNPEYLLRPVAFDLIAKMTDRIHIQGKASDGDLINRGEGYSEDYMPTRIKNKRGPKTTPVVISLTRQLENDWSVVATDKGYGIGFKNVLNYKKSQYVEAIFDQKIFDLSTDEKQYASERFQELLTEALK